MWPHRFRFDALATRVRLAGVAFFAMYSRVTGSFHDRYEPNATGAVVTVPIRRRSPGTGPSSSSAYGASARSPMSLGEDDHGTGSVQEPVQVPQTRPAEPDLDLTRHLQPQPAHSAALPLDISDLLEPPPARSAVVLEDVLPKSDWYKLYLDPAHHDEARLTYPDDPGSLYDHQLSPGFQASMRATYETFLNDPEAVARPMDWPTYEAMHDLVNSQLTQEKVLASGTDNATTFFPLRATSPTPSVGRNPRPGRDPGPAQTQWAPETHTLKAPDEAQTEDPWRSATFCVELEVDGQMQRACVSVAVLTLDAALAARLGVTMR
ncbi:MAG TPA: hypothetical protein VGX23_14995 [Actinocrinis sp.]|nr:hypothetical protein [Actinocrinis sp.]